MGRPKMTSKRQDRKLNAICLVNRKCTTKQVGKKGWKQESLFVIEQ